MPLATLPDLQTRARLLSCTASSLSHLPRASYNLAGSAYPCEFTLLHCKFAEPARSCLLQPCRVLSPGRVYFSASQVRGATSLSSCKFLGSANPCELTLLHRKFAEPPRLCLLQPCRVCSPLRV
ncbi:hypothetical protein CRG98_041819 [Punica granatum]|uniref:Uncharacterized protein n=1 Tax=Punica granatum TaxID=22663 RepID=A0A2I0I242_PUNGR|nr:hypothetical protein CRG98_041819 [Punica granatum]